MENIKVKIETYTILPKCDKCGNPMRLMGYESIEVEDGKYFWSRKLKMRTKSIDKYTCINEECLNVYLSNSYEYGNVIYEIVEDKK